jgi:valyl-tRNA synthetase
MEVYLALAGAVDRQSESARISRQLKAAETQAARLEALLSGPFAERAPSDVVDGERLKLRQAQEEAEKLRAQLRSLGAD